MTRHAFVSVVAQHENLGDAVIRREMVRWLTLPGVHLHLYGKAEPRRGRKMGHLTVTAASAAQARATALQAADVLGLPAF